MRVQWRRLRPGELNHELIWLLVTGAGAVAFALWLMSGLPLPGCTFRAVFGISCATCGSTRAALAFAAGDLLNAWRANPLTTIGLWCVVAFDLYALTVLVSRAPRLRIALPSRALRRTGIAVLLGAGLLNWIFLLWSGA